MSAALKVLTSVSDFDAFCLTSPELLHVLLCGASWDESSTQGGAMDALLLVLQSQHSALRFARIDVDTDATCALTEQLGLTLVPTTLFIREKGEVERVEGPSVEAITRRVEALSKVSTATGAALPSPSALPPSIVALRARVTTLVSAYPVMLFIKGTPSEPRCKFSRRLLEIMGEAGIAYGSFDVLSDESVRQGLKDLSQWPTYPQVFVHGKLVGGIDIVQELKESGEFATTFPPPTLKPILPSTAPPAAPAAAAGLVPAAASSSASASASSPASAPPPTDPAAAFVDAAAQARTLVIIRSSPLVLFMKGTPDAPACGFSERAVGLLRGAGLPHFKAIDVLSDPGVRGAVKALFDWPTFPMCVANGVFVGGVEVLSGMVEQGLDLAAEFKLQPVEDLGLKLERLTRAARVVLFMKGTCASPRCGFSAQARTLLGEAGVDVMGAAPNAGEAPAGGEPYSLGDFAQFDIFTDDDVREGLKKREQWPTFPMLFVAGK
jgi:Grx4 family monothiol glutaredoxin